MDMDFKSITRNSKTQNICLSTVQSRVASFPSVITKLDIFVEST